MTYNQNFHGTVSGQVAQGETVTQMQNHGLDAASLAEVFKAMRDALSSVEDPGDRDDVTHAIRELEVAVEDGNAEEIEQRAGRLKRLGSRGRLNGADHRDGRGDRSGLADVWPLVDRDARRAARSLTERRTPLGSSTT